MNSLLRLIIVMCIHLPLISHASITNDFYKISVFSMGWNGFVAQKLPEQILYENIASQQDAASVFEGALFSPSSSAESKLYAACGLWEKNRARLLLFPLPQTSEYVSVLKADMLLQVRFEKMFLHIQKNGCE